VCIGYVHTPTLPSRCKHPTHSGFGDAAWFTRRAAKYAVSHAPSSATFVTRQHQPPAVRAIEVVLHRLQAENMLPSSSSGILHISYATANLRRNKLRVHVGTRSCLTLVKVNPECQLQVLYFKSTRIRYQRVNSSTGTSTIKHNGTGQSL
jgi:hypothetical protein